MRIKNLIPKFAVLCWTCVAVCRLHYLCTGKCTVRATFEMDMKRRKASSRQTDKERQCIKDRTKTVHKKIQAKASNRQGPRLRPSANESEGRMNHTEGQAYSKERAALPFKGTRIREPRSRTARQQYRSHPTTWNKDLPQEERQRDKRHRETIQP